ncbi:putative protease Do-like 14 [Acorus calamus]|uniref:Protease Do-like 14 n=1 Tax=Acorus calamus TaxID=4465 RepID=A0AAV9EQG5_ACOCL|nr:putative protease Do-like 14 [Acorus calamus]
MVGPAVVNLSIAQSINGIVIGKSMGSGTIIDPDGTILTCAHLVMDIRSKETISKGKVEVTLQDGRSFEGTVISADFHSDIAVVKINSPTPLPAAKLGSSRKLQSGEWVIALGCPLTLQRTITAGIVSCVDRTSRDLSLGGKEREYLQTDCAINEGNSGGPLINLDGEIVGINIMKIANADGLSFAVPIDSIVKLIEHLRKNGRVARPWLGLKLLDLNDRVVAQLKERDILFPDVRKGVFVPMVYPGSPADRAGFLPNDVIIRFDGKPVEQVKEIVEALKRRDKLSPITDKLWDQPSPFFMMWTNCIPIEHADNFKSQTGECVVKGHNGINFQNGTEAPFKDLKNEEDCTREETPTMLLGGKCKPDYTTSPSSK